MTNFGADDDAIMGVIEQVSQDFSVRTQGNVEQASASKPLFLLSFFLAVVGLVIMWWAT